MIVPPARNIKPPSICSAATRKNLLSTLSDEQKTIFTRCAKSRRELQSISERLLFKNSFRLGARLMLEVMAEYVDKYVHYFV